MRQRIPFLGGDETARIARVNAQETQNLYPVVEKNAKNTITLYSTPGLKYFTTIGVGPCRANGEEWQDDSYFVSGGEFVRISENGASVSIGSLDTTGGRCVIAAGRDYIMVVDGSFGYYYDGTTFAKITDLDFPVPTFVTYIDGYFVVNNVGTDEFYISALEDPTSWNALDFEVASASHDDIDALIATFSDIYAIGHETTQIYYQSGNPDFPFSPYPNTLEVGIDAPHSLAKSADGLFWLARNNVGDKAVLQVNGFNVRVISSQDVNTTINNLSRTDDAVAYLYRQLDRTFYVISFPSADKTIAIDIETGLEHTRKSEGIGRYRACGHAYLGSLHILGDFDNNNFYTFDFDTYTDNGDVIERKRVTQVLHNNFNRIRHHRLTVEFDPGIGLVTGQGSDPQVMLRFSDDGTRTWGNELWRSIGKIGEYNKVVEWHNLGISRDRRYELKITDPVPVTILEAYADLEELEN